MSGESTSGEAVPDGGSAAYPAVRVVGGNPSPEDVAALVAVLSAVGGGGGEAPAGPVSSWASPARVVRAPLAAGPGGWQASALPR